MNSDDEDYHYSDIEAEESDNEQIDQEDQYENGDASDDDYQYSDDNASVTSDPDMQTMATASSATGAANHKSRSPHADDSSSRLSPLGASGSAAKKKRMSPGSTSMHHGQRKQQEEYRVIDEEELFQEQRALIHDVAQVVETSPSISAILLRHFGWNKEKLYEGYYADPAKAMEDAGVAHANTPAPAVPEGTLVRLFLCWLNRVWHKIGVYSLILCVMLN